MEQKEPEITWNLESDHFLLGWSQVRNTLNRTKCKMEGVIFWKIMPKDKDQGKKITYSKLK